MFLHSQTKRHPINKGGRLEQEGKGETNEQNDNKVGQIGQKKRRKIIRIFHEVSLNLIL